MNAALERAIFLATKNAGKVVEFQALFAGTGWHAATYAGYADVAEGETSYAGNAALKAEALRARLIADGMTACVLGDDSGIEVAALGGRPGVLSARYGGPGATWSERRALLRQELEESGSADRTARFVCALHFIDAAGTVRAVRESVDGAISPHDAGTTGFSYDAAFWYAPAEKTFAQLTDREKNGVSHRGRAVRALLAALRPRPDPEKRHSSGNECAAGM